MRRAYWPALCSTAVVAALAAAPAAGARLPADASAARVLPAERLTLERLTAPRSVTAGGSLRARGRVANARGRRAGTGRLTFSLRRTRAARSGIYLRAKGTARDRNAGPNVARTVGGRSRRFEVRLLVPARVPARRYFLRACVRRGSGVNRASCRTRAIRVRRRPATGMPGGPGVPGGVSGGLRSLRAPLTGESFYFVMADRFANGSTENDRGGIPGGPDDHGFDDTHKGYYHGGDLRGMLEHIDYIERLGTTAIWLTPSFKNKPVQGDPPNRSAGYHGYWITDFTQIDPHLGTNADLAALVAAAHARGMKVFFDIITNHTADVIAYQRKGEGPAPYGYVAKDDSPYRTAAGAAFDDRDFAGTDGFPALSAAESFPFVPSNPAGSGDPGDVNHKVPEWLNDVTAYHNRGDTSFTGENSLYGDFFGLDDLFTEQPRVVDGMVDIYKAWIRDFRIDGFRIDTMKHVNDEFWQRFAPQVLDYARRQGKTEFFMFGEVFDTSRPFTSHFTTTDRVQAVLDFPFQAAAQRFAAGSGPTNAMRDLFAADDWYTDADSNAYQLPTFLGNHDMGRIGFFLRGANPGATDDEILARDRLAHELMYFSRGNPVVYYGDEQGFVGDGGDQDARQDMFGSNVATYNDDDLIGTGATTSTPRFDETHPLYRAIGRLADITRDHPALRNGPQQQRLAGPDAGVLAFSRLDRRDRREYVVALNNSEQPQTAFVPTSAGRGARFGLVYGDGPATPATDPGRRLPVVVPALSTVVYRSAGPIPHSPAAPGIALAPLPEGGAARDRAEIRAFVDGDGFYDVTFLAKAGGGPWTSIGTDDNDPYRVFHDLSGLAPGTTVSYRAVVLDDAGHARESDVGSLRVAEPSLALTAPPDGGRVRDRAQLGAEVVPDHNDYAVAFQRSVEGGAWTTVATDASQPVYSARDDVSALAPGTAIRYRAVLTYAPGRTVTSAVRAVQVATPVTTAIVHYRRPAGDYADWGLHLWGAAIAPGVETTWDAPRQRTGIDTYGAYFEIPLQDDTQPVNFIVHRPSGDSVPTTREPGGDRSFVPIDQPEIWLEQGDPAIHSTPP
jgi:glycosidase